METATMLDSAAPHNDTDSPAPKGRRYWSRAEKKRILEEAEQEGVSATARKRGIEPSMLFQWRKHAQGTGNSDNKDMLMSIEYRTSLAVLEQFKTANLRVATKLMADLQAGKVATYNGVIAHSSLAGTTCKIESQRLEILEKLNDAIKAEKVTERDKVTEAQDEEEELIQQRFAEQLLVLQAKRDCGRLTVEELNRWCQNNGLGSLC